MRLTVSTAGRPDDVLLEPAAASVSDGGDEPLVRAAQAGDRAAFGRLHALYGRMVHAILLARVPRGEADDLVQDVFVTAMSRLGSLREPGAFGGWLATIARNRVVDFHRQTREQVELEEVAGLGSTSDAAEAAEALAAIRALPEAYRETLIMRLVEGMSGLEIAARTGLKPESVRVNLHRGMKLLREKLGLTDE
jgi:RNA polymerase sigma-70 factor, ECF subfamily